MPVVVSLTASALLLAGACTPTVDTPTATPTGTPAITAPTATVTATSSPSPAASSPAPTGTPTPSAFAAPTNVRLQGRLPDLSTPVPLGEAESGRVTVLWDGGEGVTGFRVYLKECDGTQRPRMELPPTDRRLGPLQPCRPSGNVGVSAVYAGGESSISWVR